MSSTQRPNKRPRSLSESDAGTKGDPSASLTSLEQDREMWFQDGNVVLVAQKTAFRVYKGLLAQQSSIFSDLFLLPPPRDGETIEGIPVVRLDDRAEELRHILLIIFCNKKCVIVVPALSIHVR